MKIVLDRRGCNCWDAACETHFGWHFLRDEITPVDCTVEMVEDGQEAITFLIKDRDGSDKVMVVDETNRAEAYDDWQAALAALPPPAVETASGEDLAAVRSSE